MNKIFLLTFSLNQLVNSQVGVMEVKIDQFMSSEVTAYDSDQNGRIQFSLKEPISLLVDKDVAKHEFKKVSDQLYMWYNFDKSKTE